MLSFAKMQFNLFVVLLLLCVSLPLVQCQRKEIDLNCRSPNSNNFIAFDRVEFALLLGGITESEVALLSADYDLCLEMFKGKDWMSYNCKLLDNPRISSSGEGVLVEFRTELPEPAEYRYYISLVERNSGENSQLAITECMNTFVIVDHDNDWDNYALRFNDATLTAASVNKHILDSGGKLPPGSNSYSQMSFEKLPDLLGPDPFAANSNGKIGKSLMATFAGGKSKEEIDILVSQFNRPEFTVILFVYDMSDWSEFNWLGDIIFIRITKTMKWWFVKHFLHPDVVSAYDYLLLIDEDCNTKGLDVDQMLLDATTYGVMIGQPANGKGSWGCHDVVRAKIHNIVDENGEVLENITPLGTWTNFVECGPFVFFSSKVWPCVFSILQPDIVSGYGYDLMWSSACAPTRTAVFHRHTMVHENRKPGSGTNKNFGGRCAAEGIFLFQRLASLGMSPLSGGEGKIFEIRDFEEGDKEVLSLPSKHGIDQVGKNYILQKWLEEDIAKKQRLLERLKEEENKIEHKLQA